MREGRADAGGHHGAIHVQPAVTSDYDSVTAVLAEHQSAVGADCPPPAEVFVDAGYVSAPSLLKAEDAGYALTGPVPAPPNSKTRFSSDSIGNQQVSSADFFSATEFPSTTLLPCIKAT